MKRIFGFIILTSIICLSLCTASFAWQGMPLLVDYADLLEESEEETLLMTLNEISERCQMDVAVVTVNTLDGKTPEEYADDFYDYNGYGYGDTRDGILLLVSMEDRDYHMSTCGFGITAFTYEGLGFISDQFLFDLSEGYYADAFTTYAELCDMFIVQARTGQPYGDGNFPKLPFEFGGTLIIAAIVGLVVSLIATGIMRGKLKSVRHRTEASDYVREGSLNISGARELYLYSQITRTEKPKESSSGSSGTHTSSSGTTHGGRGGKF